MTILLRIFNYYLILTLFYIGIHTTQIYSTSSFTEGKKVGDVDGQLINEASGLIASIQNPGYFWVHNDSGDSARLFLISETGTLAAIVHIEGAENRDWEDIAIGTPGKYGFPIIFIGDNFNRNKTKEVYLIREPKLILSNKKHLEKNIPVLETIEIGFKGKRMDIETLLFDPISEQLFFVSKRLKRPALLTIEINEDQNPAYYFKKMGSLPLNNLKREDNISGGDISQDGHHILIKTYNNIFYWKRHNLDSIAETFKKEPKILLYTPEPQGEAIGWNLDYKSFYTLSEQKRFSRPPIPLNKYRQKTITSPDKAP